MRTQVRNILWNILYPHTWNGLPRRTDPDPVEVSKLDPYDLWCMPGFGKLAMEEVVDWLAGHGLTFEKSRQETVNLIQTLKRREQELLTSLHRVQVRIAEEEEKLQRMQVVG